MFFQSGNLNRRRSHQSGRMSQAAEPCELRSLLSADGLVSEIVDPGSEVTICETETPDGLEVLSATCEINLVLDSEAPIPEEWIRFDVPPEDFELPENLMSFECFGEILPMDMKDLPFELPAELPVEVSVEFYEDAPPTDGWEPEWAYRSLIALAGITAEDVPAEGDSAGEFVEGEFVVGEVIDGSFSPDGSIYPGFEFTPDSLVIYGDDGSILEVIPLDQTEDLAFTTSVPEGTESGSEVFLVEQVVDELKRELSDDESVLQTDGEEIVTSVEDIPVELLMLMSMMTMTPDSPSNAGPEVSDIVRSEQVNREDGVLSTPARAALNQQRVLFGQQAAGINPATRTENISVAATETSSATEERASESGSTGASVATGLSPANRSRSTGSVRVQLNRLRKPDDGTLNLLADHANQNEQPTDAEMIAAAEAADIEGESGSAPAASESP